MFLSLFGNINIIKILGFGLSGLSLLLMVLTYQLLNKVINLPEPNNAVISLIKWYMGITVLVLLVVGLFTIPVFNNNNDLSKSNEVLVKSSELNAHIDTLKQSTDIGNQTEQLKIIKDISDDLVTKVEKTNPELKSQVLSFNNEVDSLITVTDYKAKRKDTSNFKKNTDFISNQLKVSFNHDFFSPMKADLMKKD